MKRPSKVLMDEFGHALGYAVAPGRGMQRQLRCECGTPLGVDDGDRCPACRPQLSLQAQARQKERDALREELAARKREIEWLETEIRKLHRRIRRWR